MFLLMFFSMLLCVDECDAMAGLGSTDNKRNQTRYLCLMLRDLELTVASC